MGSGAELRGYLPGGYTDPFRVLGVRTGDMLVPHSHGSAGNLSSATVSQMDRGAGRPWHPDSPLFWFGMLAAVTFGLIGGATSLRVGPFRASASAGGT